MGEPKIANRYNICQSLLDKAIFTKISIFEDFFA